LKYFYYVDNIDDRIYLIMGVVIIFMADLFLIKKKEKKERKVEEILSRDKSKQDLNVDQYGGET